MTIDDLSKELGNDTGYPVNLIDTERSRLLPTRRLKDYSLRDGDTLIMMKYENLDPDAADTQLDWHEKERKGERRRLLEVENAQHDSNVVESRIEFVAIESEYLEEKVGFFRLHVLWQLIHDRTY